MVNLKLAKERTVKLSITLKPAHVEFLTGFADKPSQAIQYLIENSRNWEQFIETYKPHTAPAAPSGKRKESKK